jgi:hypothetical protein
VGALSRIGLAAAVLAAAAVAGVLALGRSGSVPAIAPTPRVVVHASFEPPAAQFGDRVTARVVVELDRNAVRPGTLRLGDDLAPLTQLAAAHTSHVVRGSLELVTVVVPVACLTDPCVARSGVTRLAFPQVRATVVDRGGRVERVSRPWPPLPVRARVAASDLAAAEPPFEVDTATRPPSYRVAPATLAALLDALAALCALGAVAFAAWQALVLARRRRPAPVAGELERALRLAREAEARPESDRRRALGLLSRVLARDNLSRAASDLAWSEPKPEPGQLAELVSEIEGSP